MTDEQTSQEIAIYPPFRSALEFTKQVLLSPDSTMYWQGGTGWDLATVILRGNRDLVLPVPVAVIACASQDKSLFIYWVSDDGRLAMSENAVKIVSLGVLLEASKLPPERAQWLHLLQERGVLLAGDHQRLLPIKLTKTVRLAEDGYRVVPFVPVPAP